METKVNSEKISSDQAPDGYDHSDKYDYAAATRRHIAATITRIETLTVDAVALSRGNPLNAERIQRAVFAAVEQFDLCGTLLPRGYAVYADKRVKAGFVLKMAGGTVPSEAQVALDYATGWLDEFAEMIARRLERTRIAAAEDDDVEEK